LSTAVAAYVATAETISLTTFNTGKEDDFMNNEKTNLTATEAVQPDLVKRIGKTTYKVKIHFNPDSRETMSDKIIRLLRNEVSQNPKL
jgi:hypothetical protein